MYRYKRHSFDNGLTFIAGKMPGMKSVSIGIWVGVGGRYEDTKNRGISHFIEHLLFKGTRRMSGLAIKNTIEGIGGSLNGFTSEEVTCYLVKVLPRYQRLALDILSDMVLNASFNPRDLERERLVILEEIKMYKDQPDQYAEELLSGLLWPNQNMGIPLVGTYDIVKSLKREDLISYKRKTYNPANMAVAACGDVDSGALLNALKKRFLSKRGGERSRYEEMSIIRDGPTSNICRKETEQTHVAMGFHGISRENPSRHALDIMSIILGGNMSSRLFHELREKRALAYAVGSRVTYFNDGGALVIDGGVDKRRVTEFVKLTLKELMKLKARNVTADELKRAKEYYRGHLLFSLEETASHMLWLGKKVMTTGKVPDASAVLRNVDAVTARDVRDISKKIFRKDNLNVSAVGPLGAKDRELTAGLHKFL